MIEFYESLVIPLRYKSVGFNIDMARGDVGLRRAVGQQVKPGKDKQTSHGHPTAMSC